MLILTLLLCLLTAMTATLILITRKLNTHLAQQQELHDEVHQLGYALTDISHNLMSSINLLHKIKMEMDAEKIAHATQKTVATGESAYKQALKMVEIGANLEDIISTCSLTRAEVQLLMNLKRFDTVRQ